MDRWETESRFARFQVVQDPGPDSSATFARNFAPTILRQSAAQVRAQFPRKPARCESDYSADWIRRSGRSLSDRDSDRQLKSAGPAEARTKLPLRRKVREQMQPRASRD